MFTSPDAIPPSRCPASPHPLSKVVLERQLRPSSIRFAQTQTTREQVFVDGSPCLRVVHTPGSEETELTCVSPAITATSAAAILAAASGGDNGTYGFFDDEEWASTIEVVNGRMPGLTHVVRYLSYQVRVVQHPVTGSKPAYSALVPKAFRA